MKRYILYFTLFIILGIGQVNAQTAFYCENCNVVLREGVTLYVEGDYVDNTTVANKQLLSVEESSVLITKDLYHNGSQNLFRNGDRTNIVLWGSGEQRIKGSSTGKTNFYNFSVIGSNNILDRDIVINHNLALTDLVASGNLALNGHYIHLEIDPNFGSSLYDVTSVKPTILENTNYRIYGTNGGIRFENFMFSSNYFNSQRNIGNIGFEIQKPGLTELSIERAHKISNVNATNSIQRYYDITSTNGSNSGANVKFNYLDGGAHSDLPPGVIESDLVFFKRNITTLGSLQPGTSWLNDSLSTIDIVNDFATNNNIENLTNERFTLVECQAPALSASSSLDSVCVNSTVTLDAGTGAGWTYLWSNGETTQSIDVSRNYEVTAKYYVIVTDGRGCYARDSVEVAWLDFPTIDFSPEEEIVCEGLSLELNPSVTGEDLTYIWSTGENTPSILHTSNGSQSIEYTVTVTSYGRCSVSESKQVNDVLNPVVDLGEDIVNCEGDPQTIVAGPSSGFVYQWRDGSENVLSNSNQITVNETDYYYVDVTEIATGCMAYDDIRVGISDIQLSYTKNNVACNGQAGGSIYLTIDGISGDYIVEWSNGAETVDLIGVEAGTYSVTVTDMEGCSANLQNISVSEPSPLTVNPTIVHDLCDLGTGSIISNLSGGVQPYQSINWYNQNDPQGGPFAFTQDVSGLSYGEYIISVIDANGCQFDEIFTVQGGPVTPSYTPVVVDISCPDADDGSIEILNLSGGNAPYSYLWSNGETSSSINDLEPGTYSLTATDVNGCIMITSSYTLEDPPLLTLSLDHKMDVLCNGAATGELGIEINTTVQQYFILWSTGESTENIDGLVAGEYSVTVTYGNSCTATMDFTINEASEIKDNPNVIDDLCYNNGGSIAPGISGGVGPYTYSWSNGATSPDLSGLSKGTYTVTVNDANQCSFSNTYQIEDLPPLNIIENHEDVLCADSNTGSIELFFTGGTFPLEYTWSNGSTSRVLNDLAPGVYSVTATDANGCTDDLFVFILNASEILVEEEITDVTEPGAADGMINLTISGGTGEYSFLWSNGEMTEDIAGLEQGIYGVTIQDSNGCVIEKSFSISEPNTILVESEIYNPMCFGDASGGIDLSLSGGVEPYSFSWSNGANTEDLSNLGAGIYTVSITDDEGISAFKSFEIIEPKEIKADFEITNNLCYNDQVASIQAQVSGGSGEYTFLWSNEASEATIENLDVGFYTLTITDEHSCSIIESVEITQPNQLVATISSNNVTSSNANDGSASVEVTGGTAPYTYLWSNGQISSSISNLSGGDYSVTITDKNGCLVSASTTILDPSSISASAEIVHLDCAGGTSGSIDFTVNGGSEPYTYLWSNGANSEDLNGLNAGIYVVTVTDNVGLSASFTYEINEPNLIVIAGSEIIDVDCGGSTGSISVDASGGTGVLSYLWSTGETGSAIEMKEAGDYTLTISDENGCSITETFVISSSSEIELSTSSENSSCGENFDGSIDLTISGGITPYTINWSNGQISEDLINLGPGTYTVTVTDAKSCEATTSVTITGGSNFTIIGSVQDVSCFNSNDGSISISTDGATGDLIYEWSNGSISETINNLDKGSYTVTVTDENGCSAESTFVILEPAPMVLNLNASLAGCSEENDGSLSVEISGGASPYVYQWSNGATTSRITNLSPGEYDVTVTDDNGCSASLSTQVQETDQMLTAKFLVASPVRETETLQFLDLSFPKPSAWLYKFGDPKNSTSTEEDPLFKYPNDPSTAESIYSATLIVSSIACIDSTTKEIRIINTRNNGVNEPQQIDEPFYTEIQDVKVYPNPAMDYVNTEIELNQEDKVDIRLVNMNGQILRHFSMSESQVYFERINLSNLQAGYYFIYVTSGADSVIKKIVVIR